MAVMPDIQSGALKAGTPYHVRVDRTEVRRSSKGGLLLEVKFLLLAGGFNGNEIPTEYFNIVNQDGRAEAIAEKKMRDLCRAAGRSMPRSKNDLLGAECLITLNAECEIAKFTPVPKSEIDTVDTVDTVDTAQAAKAETANGMEADGAEGKAECRTDAQLEPRSGLAKNVYDAYIACAKEHGTPDMINENDGCFYLEQKVWHDYFCEHGRSRKNETYTRKRDASRGFSAGLEALIARCDISTKDTGYSWRLAEKLDTELDRKEIIDIAKTREPRKEGPVTQEWMLEAEHKAEAE